MKTQCHCCQLVVVWVHGIATREEVIVYNKWYGESRFSGEVRQRQVGVARIRVGVTSIQRMHTTRGRLSPWSLRIWALSISVDIGNVFMCL